MASSHSDLIRKAVIGKDNILCHEHTRMLMYTVNTCNNVDRRDYTRKKKATLRQLQKLFV